MFPELLRALPVFQFASGAVAERKSSVPPARLLIVPAAVEPKPVIWVLESVHRIEPRLLMTPGVVE
ncbi:MAG: hypothetical protein R3F11_13430 [Verrucomicrobiales bacterium]